MSTQQRQLLADGALGSHPDAHLLLFAHPAELFGEIRSAKATGSLVEKCEKSIRVTAESTIKRESNQRNTLLQSDSISERTLLPLLNSDGTVLRITKESEPELGPEGICFAIIS
jgi:exonuclease V gamma subunit